MQIYMQAIKLLFVGSEMFTVDPNTGGIQLTCDPTVAASLDRELQEEYRLNVQATDSSNYEVSNGDFSEGLETMF